MVASLNLISLSQLVLYDTEKSINLLVEQTFPGNLMNVIHFSELAPAEGLSDFWKKSDKSEVVWDIYSQEFLREMQSVEKQIALRVVERLVNCDLTVNMFFLGNNSARCHRSLLYTIFEERGIYTNLM